MKKIWVILFFLSIPLSCFSQESVTITTYYPSPSGAYKQLTSNYLKFNPQSTAPATPATGMLYWDNGPGQGGVPGFYYWDGLGWNFLAGAGGGGLWTELDGDIYREDGNVGIGTTDPQAQLEIGGIGNLRIKPDPAIAPNVRLISENVGNRQSSISFAMMSGGSEFSLWTMGSDITLQNTTNFSIYDSQAIATRLYIDSAGNVGIGTGTTTPASRLEVNGVVTATDFGCTGCLGVPEINQTAFQRRVGGAGCPGTCSCPLEQSIRVINEDGTVICEPDSISAGGGVSQILAGSNITISPVGGTGAVTINSSGGGGGGVDGSGTANKVSKWTDSDTLSDSQIYDNGASVGIGTVIPANWAKIEVFGGSNGQINKLIYLNSPAGAANTGQMITTERGAVFGAVDDDGAGTTSFRVRDTGGNNKLYVGVYGTYSGRVGIGTTLPAAKLEVAGQVKITEGSPGLGKVLTSDATGLASWQTPSSGMGGSGTVNYIPKFTGASAIGNSAIYESSGNVGIGTTDLKAKLVVFGESGSSVPAITDATAIISKNAVSTSNNYIGIIAGGGSVSGGNAGIYFGNASFPTDGAIYYNNTITGSNSRYMVIKTSGSERVRISADGYVGIGRTPTTNRLEVGGTASKTTAGDWLANSDRRIKTDIKDIDNAIEVINKLHPVKFRYTKEYREKDNLIEDKYYYNFIAQEFQKVFPDSVQEDGEGFLQIDTHIVKPYLVRAMQEFSKQVEELKTENETLKKRIEALEKKFNIRQ